MRLADRLARWPSPAKTGAYAFTLTVAGVAHAAAMAWPMASGLALGQPVWWLQIVSLSVLIGVVGQCVSGRAAAAAGLYFSVSWLCGTYWWLYVAMHTYGDLAAPLASSAVLSLSLALGLYYGGACYVTWMLRTRSGAWSGWVFASLWTCAEMARGTWLTGFGWGSAGYAHIDGPLAFLIPWIGAYGLALVAALVAWQVTHVRRTTWLARVLTVALLVAGSFAAHRTSTWTASTGTLSVTLLQGNIPQDEKFQAGSGVPFALKWYAERLRANTSSLVVAPETAIPLLPQQLPPEYWDGLRQRFAQGDQAALIGIPLGNMREGYTNSVLGLVPASDAAWRYDKHHLVPFGEFIPPLFKWFTQLMNIPLGNFNRGDLGQPSLQWAGQRLAPNICYEDLFGEELAARFRQPDEAPTVFVNVSNIGWFGDSIAIDQHLNISRMRALEFQRPFVRATNTGATVILNHRAEVTAALPRYTRAVLEGSVEGRTGLTPFAWWASRWGLWPLWCFAFLVVGWAWVRRR